MSLIVIQILPALDAGGVERGTVEVAAGLVRAGHRAVVISAGGRLVQELKQAGGEHIDLPIGTKSLLLLRCIPTLRRLFAEADIVHVRSRFPAWLTWLAWRGMDKKNRPALITTVHGAYSVNRYSQIMTQGEKVIAVSDYIRDYVINNYPATDPGKITVIHRGIDPSQYYREFRPTDQWLQDWQREYPQLQDKFILTLPGRITRLKGHEHFLKILSGLQDKGLNVHGLIVGGAHGSKQDYLESLKKTAAAMAIDQSITFTGHRNDLREIMTISNIVLCLSRQPEAFGRTALESLSLGTPVIAYDHGGTREILQALLPEGLVALADIDSLINRVEQFYRQPPAVTAANPFLLEDMLKRTINCYEEMAQRRSQT